MSTKKVPYEEKIAMTVRLDPAEKKAMEQLMALLGTDFNAWVRQRLLFELIKAQIWNIKELESEHDTEVTYSIDYNPLEPEDGQD